MVVIEYKPGELGKDHPGIHYYMDGWLYKQCMRVKEKINNFDQDKIILIDGKERCGKSVLGMQIAKAIDPSFTVERECLTPDEFEHWISHGQKGQVIVYDEANNGLGSDISRSQITTILRSKIMEMGQLNLCVIIILPKIWKLEPYVAKDRTDDTGLLHVYKKKLRGGKEQLGNWVYFSPNQKEIIYHLGKKFGGQFSYNSSKVGRARHRGRFYEQYPIDEQAYRLKKREALQRVDGGNKYRFQRDVLFKILYEDAGFGLEKISGLCRSRDFVIGKSQVHNIIKKS